MSRLINADELIEFIENRYDITWKDDYEGGIKDACTDILEKINKMQTIESERKIEWIPCSERLPEEDGEYIVTLDNGCVDTSGCSKNGFSIDAYAFANGINDIVQLHVIAWRPFPDPMEV